MRTGTHFVHIILVILCMGTIFAENTVVRNIYIDKDTIISNISNEQLNVTMTNNAKLTLINATDSMLEFTVSDFLADLVLEESSVTAAKQSLDISSLIVENSRFESEEVILNGGDFSSLNSYLVITNVFKCGNVSLKHSEILYKEDETNFEGEGNIAKFFNVSGINYYKFVGWKSVSFEDIDIVRSFEVYALKTQLILFRNFHSTETYVNVDDIFNVNVIGCSFTAFYVDTKSTGSVVGNVNISKVRVQHIAILVPVKNIEVREWELFGKFNELVSQFSTEMLRIRNSEWTSWPWLRGDKVFSFEMENVQISNVDQWGEYNFASVMGGSTTFMNCTIKDSDFTPKKSDIMYPIANEIRFFSSTIENCTFPFKSEIFSFVESTIKNVIFPSTLVIKHIGQSSFENVFSPSTLFRSAQKHTFNDMSIRATTFLHLETKILIELSDKTETANVFNVTIVDLNECDYIFVARALNSYSFLSLNDINIIDSSSINVVYGYSKQFYAQGLVLMNCGFDVVFQSLPYLFESVPVLNDVTVRNTTFRYLIYDGIGLVLTITNCDIVLPENSILYAAMTQANSLLGDCSIHNSTILALKNAKILVAPLLSKSFHINMSNITASDTNSALVYMRKIIPTFNSGSINVNGVFFVAKMVVFTKSIQQGDLEIPKFHGTNCYMTEQYMQYANRCIFTNDEFQGLADVNIELVNPRMHINTQFVMDIESLFKEEVFLFISPYNTFISLESTTLNVSLARLKPGAHYEVHIFTPFGSLIGDKKVFQEPYCEPGFFLDEDGECERCMSDTHQWSFNSTVSECTVDTKLRDAVPSYFERSLITGSEYNVDPGKFVLETDDTVYVLRCHNSFCHNFLVKAGFSGKSLVDFSSTEQNIMKYLDIRPYRVNGCAPGHYGTGCTRCNPLMRDDTGMDHESVMNIFTSGCIVRAASNTLVITVIVAQVIFLLVLVFNYHRMIRLPWTRIFRITSDDLLDADVFHIIDSFKYFVIIMLPLLLDANSLSTDFVLDSKFLVFLKLFINPYASISLFISMFVKINGDIDINLILFVVVLALSGFYLIMSALSQFNRRIKSFFVVIAHFLLPLLIRNTMTLCIFILSYDTYDRQYESFYHTIADYDREFNFWMALISAGLCLSVIGILFRIHSKIDNLGLKKEYNGFTIILVVVQSIFLFIIKLATTTNSELAVIMFLLSLSLFVHVQKPLMHPLDTLFQIFVGFLVGIALLIKISAEFANLAIFLFSYVVIMCFMIFYGIKARNNSLLREEHWTSKYLLKNV
ncbi:hypothetical protein PCE1_000723 [Barthelona sp. PCE]